MKKTLITVSVATILGLGSLASGFPLSNASANSKIDSLKDQQSEIKEKESEISSQLNEKSTKLNEVKSEQQHVDQEIQRIDLAVSDTEVKIKEKEVEITEAEATITELEEEIVVLEERIEKRNVLLKDRARSFQENGRVTYLDVLLGAKSFSDFIDRIGAVAVFVEADQSILDEHRNDKNELESKQTEMEEELSGLQEMHTQLEGMKKTLSSQKAEKEKVMSALKKEEEEMHAEMLALEEEEALLAAQKRAMQKAIELEQQRIAEQKRKEEEAKKASSSNGSSGGSSAVSTPSVSSGVWTRPAAGYVSSNFGIRSLGNHKGVDIAKGGYVPIVAAADGVVIRSYYSSSYGNAIFISHSINGQIYTTVYAHMSSRGVSEGQAVSKGQQIGVMGNTGRSYGQHLHFELHKGPWKSGQPNAINPAGIVPL